MRSTAALHAARVLGAVALLVSILDVLIDHVIRRQGLAAMLAGLATGVVGGVLALYLAAALKLAAGDRAQASLHVGVERVWRGVAAGINFRVRVGAGVAFSLRLTLASHLFG